jgi:hypothetical protein
MSNTEEHHFGRAEERLGTPHIVSEESRSMLCSRPEQKLTLTNMVQHTVQYAAEKLGKLLPWLVAEGRLIGRQSAHR